jgi:hypothetical protein
MRLARWIVAALVVAHGLIHVLGAAKGLGWFDVSALQRPVTFGLGIAWLLTGALVIGAGLLLARSIRSWWTVGAVAVAASQAMLFTAWSDAAAGTAANLVLLLAVVYGFASQGPPIDPRRFHRDLGHALRHQPVPQLDQPPGERRELPGLLRTPATPIRHTDRAHHRRLMHVQARAAVHNHIHRRLLGIVGTCHPRGPGVSRL